jgi:pimeloyl-[acyl-carrier protein] methyl ester esterase
MTLAVERLGAGPDLVLLHGWALGRHSFGRFTHDLAARHRVHEVDLPGYGTSPARACATLADLAEELVASIDCAATVVGWSLGALAALAWADAAPAQVQRLVLIAGTPCFTRRPDWPHAMSPEVFASFANAVTADVADASRRFLGLQAAGMDDPRATLRELRANVAQATLPDAATLADGLALLASSDMRQAASHLCQPTLTVHGDRDALVPAAAGGWLAKALPHGNACVIKGAAHVPFVSHRVEVVAAVTDFIHG